MTDAELVDALFNNAGSPTLQGRTSMLARLQAGLWQDNRRFLPIRWQLGVTRRNLIKNAYQVTGKIIKFDILSELQ